MGQGPSVELTISEVFEGQGKPLGVLGSFPLPATLETQWSPCGSTMVRGASYGRKGIAWDESRKYPRL